MSAWATAKAPYGWTLGTRGRRWWLGTHRRTGADAPPGPGPVRHGLRAARPGGDRLRRRPVSMPGPRPCRTSLARSASRTSRPTRASRARAHHPLMASAGWVPADVLQLASTQIIDLSMTEEELWHDVYKSSRRYANGARKKGCYVVRRVARPSCRSSTTSSPRPRDAAASSREPSRPTPTSTVPSGATGTRASSSATCPMARRSRAR